MASPPAVLVELLADQRRAGIEFAAAWPQAAPAAVAAAPARERGAWKQALNATRPAWAAAYEQPAQRDGANANLTRR